MVDNQSGLNGCEPEAALARLGDDRQLYREVLDRFFADSPEALARIADAIAQDDGEQLHRAAHSFKGLAAMAGTVSVSQLAAQLEAVGKEGELIQAPHLLDQLRNELQKARTALASYME